MAKREVGAMIIEKEPEIKRRNCSVVEFADGSVQVTFVIEDPATVRRYRSRLGKMGLAEYLWENVIKRAVDGAVW